jgi:hypothetical protein
VNCLKHWHLSSVEKVLGTLIAIELLFIIVRMSGALWFISSTLHCAHAEMRALDALGLQGGPVLLHLALPAALRLLAATVEDWLEELSVQASSHCQNLLLHQSAQVDFHLSLTRV